jgi:cell division protein FtsI (penicillin-binding protein 3)
MRLAFVFVSFVLVFGLVIFRLVQLQIFLNPNLESLAKKQFQKVAAESSYRLPILDRNGEELAVSIRASSVFARPKLVTRKRETARVLAKFLGGTREHWLEKLKAQKLFIWIQRQVSEEVARKLAKENLPGIFVQPENKRIYPNERLAANVLGFTDIDGKGLSGVELALDSALTRKESKLRIIRDGKGTPSYIEGQVTSPEPQGVSLTIDRQLQNVMEEELDAAMSSMGAKAIMAVVMDPHTGEIFAMGQRPSFDPNSVSLSSKDAFANRLISHLFEPGSTMKVIFASEALQDGILSTDSPLDCGNGEIWIGKKRIGEAEANHRFKVLPLEKVIKYSSNVGAVRISQALGEERVRATIEKFGFTEKTGIGLPGETSSPAKPDSFWVPLFQATVGFGQGISVTPMQMVTAYAALANGGYLVRPKILMSELAPEGKEPFEVRRVLSPHTVQLMRQVLIGVTEDGGTGVQARVPGIRVAGKTGTAQKYEQGFGYEHKKYFSSFIGFLPADQPELIIGVFVDEPRGQFYGGQVAAPIFKHLAERSLQLLDRMPKGALAESERHEKAPAQVAVPEIKMTEGKTVMPDLQGVSVRDALRALEPFTDKIKIAGSGYVDSQVPQPGSPLTLQTMISLHLNP